MAYVRQVIWVMRNEWIVSALDITFFGSMLGSCLFRLAVEHGCRIVLYTFLMGSGCLYFYARRYIFWALAYCKSK